MHHKFLHVSRLDTKNAQVWQLNTLKTSAKGITKEKNKLSASHPLVIQLKAVEMTSTEGVTVWMIEARINPNLLHVAVKQINWGSAAALPERLVQAKIFGYHGKGCVFAPKLAQQLLPEFIWRGIKNMLFGSLTQKPSTIEKLSF